MHMHVHMYMYGLYWYCLKKVLGVLYTVHVHNYCDHLSMVDVHVHVCIPEVKGTIQRFAHVQMALQISIPVLSCTGNVVPRSRCVLGLPQHVRRGRSSCTKRSHCELRGP